MRRPRRLEGRVHRGRRPEGRCRCCGRRFTSHTGTVLEHCRKQLATWVSLIRPMRHNVPVECAAEPCGVTRKTAFEWRHRVLATVSDYQDRIVLRDTVWIGETYLSKDYGQAGKRGPSRQKLCICVAIDIHKDPVAVACGHRKPSSARVRKDMGGRIAPGSLLIHDLERAHGASCRSMRDGARLLFQIFADAYERQSVVITANLEFSRWGSVFGDDQMAAVIDRIIHHGRLVQFRGESYRVRHALMREE